MCYDSAFISNYIHYQPPTSGLLPNHAVAIVGWDDNKVTQAPLPGAWLCKNSWGATWGEQGYFWISYYDKHCGQHPEMGAISFQDAEPLAYDTIYYHDYHGWRDTKTDASEAFNAFTAAGASVGAEKLVGVSFFTAEDDVTFTVKIYDRFEGGVLLDELASQTGTCGYRGFHTIDLDTPLHLVQGDEFFVYLALSAGGHPYDRTSDVPVLLGASYRVIVESSAEPDQSFYRSGGVWEDLYYFNDTANFCIKALTVAEPVLKYDFPDGLPEGILPPGAPTPMTLEIASGIENYVPGTGMLHYRFDPADPYSTMAVTPLGGDLYEVVLPNTAPGDAPEFYFSALGDGGTTVCSPFDAPASVYSFDLGIVETLFHDDFESDLGWTVENINLTDGPWERGVPAGGGDRGDPPVDFDGSGNCYVTDNEDGDSDVDGGPTRLISPLFDLSSGDAEISYTRWHYNDDNNDNFTVEISNDGGSSWTIVEQMKHTDGWNTVRITVSDFVTPTSQMKMRFSAVDNPNDSVTEAGLDAFSVERIHSTPSIWAGAYTIKAATGSAIQLSLDAGTAYANRRYIVGGSMSGSYPGMVLPGGMVIPINRDFLTRHIYFNLNSPRYQNFLGRLDGQGKAAAVLDTQGPVSPVHVGRTVSLAFTLTGAFDYVSNPVFIAIEP
jgi:hypothetical protein